MAECYGYLNANVQGTDKSITPTGFLQMPSEQVQLILKCFRDGQASFRHGMCMIRVNQNQSYYLRACSRPQSAATSAAEATCVFAGIRSLVTNDFTDENLDKLLGFPFPSELNIVNGIGVESNNEFSEKIEAQHIGREIITAILVGCFGRWLNRTSPIYISLPNDDFENSLSIILKSIYLEMPYSLRAHSGYMTFPIASYAIPEFVSLCFIPESWCGRFNDEPILSMDATRCGNAISKVIERSHLDRNTQQYVEHIVNANSKERQELHKQMYELIEGNGDANKFTTLNGRLYGDAFVLLHDWNEYSDKQKEDYVLEFVNKPETPLTEMIWRIIGLYVTNNRLSELISGATNNCKTFYDFAKSLKSLLLIKNKLSLDDAWRIALYDFTTKLRVHQDIKKQYESVKASLRTLFFEDVLNECERLVMEAHTDFVKQEQEHLQEKINNIIRSGHASQLINLFKSIYDVSAEYSFEENKCSIQSYAVQRITRVFVERCNADNAFIRYQELREAYRTLTSTYISSDNDACAIWTDYNDRYQSALVDKFIRQFEDDKPHYQIYCELLRQYNSFRSTRRLDGIDIGEKYVKKIDSSWNAYCMAFYRKQTDTFIRLVEADKQFKKYLELQSIYNELSQPINPYHAEIVSRWIQYEANYREYEKISNNLLAYFELLATGKSYPCNPNWSPVKYSNSFFEFKFKSKARDDIMAGITERAFEDWKKLSKNPVFISELMDEGIDRRDKLPAFNKRLLRMDALGTDDINISLLTKDRNGYEHTISLKEAVPFISWLLSDRQRLLELSNAQLWFAYDLTSLNVLCEQDIKKLFGAEGDKKMSAQLVMVAAKSVLADDEFRNTFGTHSALGFLSQKHQISSDHKNNFLDVAQNEEEKQILRKEWENTVVKAKRKKSPPMSKATKLKLIGDLAALCVILFLCVVGFFSVVNWFKRDTTPALPSSIETSNSTPSPSETSAATKPSTVFETPKINPPLNPIRAGDSFTLNVEGIEYDINVFWSSSDNSCVYALDGQKTREVTLKALTAGTVILQVHRENKNGEVISEITITVEEAEEQPSPSSDNETGTLRIEKSKETIYVGDEFTLEIKGIASSSQVFWTSDNFNVIEKVSGEKTQKVTVYAAGTGKALLQARRNDKDGDVISQIEINVRKAES